MANYARKPRYYIITLPARHPHWDKGLRRLLWQYLKRCVEHGGVFRDVEKGISLGGSLSPLIGAICLMPIDQLLTRDDVFYIRFMNDWVVLAKTRRQLRKAVKQTNQMLCRLILERHPDKTLIGLIEKGFDFLGYHFTSKGLSVAKSMLDNFFTKATRLYEQSLSALQDAERAGNYVKRWQRWVYAGLDHSILTSILTSINDGSSTLVLLPSGPLICNHYSFGNSREHSNTFRINRYVSR